MFETWSSLPFCFNWEDGLDSILLSQIFPPPASGKGRDPCGVCGRGAVVPSVGTDPIHPGGTREVRQGKLDEAGKGETQGPVHMKPQMAS